LGSKKYRNQERKAVSARRSKVSTTRRMGITALVLAAVIISLVIFVQPWLDSDSKSSRRVSHRSVRPAVSYELLLEKATPNPVSRIFSPVALFADDEFKGTGTIANFDSSLSLVLSSVHVFLDRGKPLSWTYREISTLNSERHEIKELKRLTDWESRFAFEPDIVVALPGPAQAIKGFADWQQVLPLAPNFPYPVGEMKDEVWLTSLVTGQRFRVLLAAADPRSNAIPYFFFDWAIRPGESGTGFIVDGRDDALVVVGGSFVLPLEIRNRYPAVIGDITEIAWGCPVQLQYDPKKANLSFRTFVAHLNQQQQ